MMKKPIRDIVIVGGGSAGWMTAAALSKYLGTKRFSITVVESDQIGTVGVGEATIPLIQTFNQALGIDEIEFLKATNGTFKLGIDFVNWGKLGHRYFHPFGIYGVDMDGIQFTHFWLRWVKAGGDPDNGLFNAETEASRVKKFMKTPPQNPMTLPRITYAYHFDASLYAQFLRRMSEKAGVVRTEGLVVKVNQHPESGHIAGIELKDGRVINGDFFVDCSGFRGLLIEQTLQAGYEDWSKWLPMNRAAATQCERVEDPTPYTRSTAYEAGWQWRIPLQHRTGAGYVFSSEFISEDEATVKFIERLDGKPLADPKILKFVTGRRRHCWVKNCVAIGLAGGFLEPLESTSLHLGQVAISKLLALFPTDWDCQPLIDRYNREMEAEYTNTKDFLIAHYKVTEREDQPLWKYCKHMDIPDGLKARFELFRVRGEAGASLIELFKETSWFAVLYGQGMRPEGYHPVADNPTDEELNARLARIRAAVKERVDDMPTQEEWISKNCAAKGWAMP